MKRLILAGAVPLLMAMGDGRATIPPVALPGDAAIPGSGLNRAGQRPAQPDAPPPPRPAETLRILEAREVGLDAFQWQSRVIVIFADTAADPSLARQLQELQGQPAPLIARDVVVLTDTDPATGSPWRSRLRPEGFSLVLIDKDGQVKARKPLPWTVREIARAIDKFPSRLEEIGRAGIGL